MSHIAKFSFRIITHPLKLERYEVPLASEFQYVPVYVKDTDPHHITLAVEGLYGRAQIILHDTVAVLLGELCHWGVAIAIVAPRYEVVIRLFAVITCSPEVIGQHLRFLIRAVAPLMQQHVAVPCIAMACVVRLFKGTPAQGIVLKPYGGTFGCAYAPEHAVAVPLVGGISLLPAIMSLQLLVIEGTKKLRVLLILPKRSLFRWQSPKTTIVTINCFF